MESTQTILNAYWSQRAGAYHRHHLHSERAEADRKAWTEIFAQHLPKDAVRVIDAGTGDGFVAHLIAQLGYEVVGVDASEGMLDEARDEAELGQERGLAAARFVEADATDLPESLRDFDVVTSRYLLWTLREPVKALRSWAEALVPGGLVLAADANWFSEGIPRDIRVEADEGADSFVKAYGHSVVDDLPLAQASTPEAYAEVFREAGLQDVQIHSLPQIQEIDKQFGVSPGHESKPHFLISGRTPA